MPSRQQRPVFGNFFLPSNDTAAIHVDRNLDVVRQFGRHNYAKVTFTYRSVNNTMKGFRGGKRLLNRIFFPDRYIRKINGHLH